MNTSTLRIKSLIIASALLLTLMGLIYSPIGLDFFLSFELFGHEFMDVKYAMQVWSAYALDGGFVVLVGSFLSTFFVLTMSDLLFWD